MICDRLAVFTVTRGTGAVGGGVGRGGDDETEEREELLDDAEAEDDPPVEVLAADQPVPTTTGFFAAVACLRIFGAEGGARWDRCTMELEEGLMPRGFVDGPETM